MSQAELDERIRDVQTTVARQQAVTMHKLVEKCKPMINPTALAKVTQPSLLIGVVIHRCGSL